MSLKTPPSSNPDPLETTLDQTLDTPQPSINHNAPKTKKGFKKGRWQLAGLVLVLLVCGLYGFFTFLTVKNQVSDGATHLQNAVDSLKTVSSTRIDQAFVGRLETELKAADTNFRQAKRALGPFEVALPLLGWLPKVGYDVSNLGALLEIAQKGAQAGGLILEAGEPAVAILTADKNDQSGSRLTKLSDTLSTAQAQQKFEQAYQLIGEISQQRTKLDATRLGLDQSRKAISQLDQQFPVLRDSLNLARQLPALLPQLTGKNQPVNYLVVIQNSDELRPSGGFISAVGLVSFSDGKLSVQNFQDSYQVDADPNLTHPAAIEPLARYMGAGYLALRDANWWPDFPTSARQLLDLYQKNQPIRPDGVIALDIQSVTSIFEAFGPLDLPDYNEHLTAQNFEERLHYYFLPPGTPTGGDWWLKRKEFIGVTLKALLARFNTASVPEYLKLGEQLGKSATQKHLQFYFSSPELEKQLTGWGLDGAQLQIPAQPDNQAGVINDYLMLTEANLGFNKVNPKIDRQMAYTVSAPGSGASMFASLTVTYTSRAGVREGTPADQCIKVAKYDSSYDAMINGCYWNYLRIYVPEGSQLRNSQGFAADSPLTSSSENHKTVFASQIVLAPGQTQVFTINYILPYHWQSTGQYKLTVQKQAGLLAIPLTTQFDTESQSRRRQTSLENDQTFDLYP